MTPEPRSPRFVSHQTIVEQIAAARAATPPSRALLVGISGIDGSGKGSVTSRLEQALTLRGLRVANVNVDPWLQLPERRFDASRPGAHFYENGIRFEGLFDQLVRPLREQRRLRLLFDATDATNAPDYYSMRVEFDDIDVILLEGIFLFSRSRRALFDLAIWVDCGFATALQRALRRNQEGLAPDEIIRDYETIYFAAQRIHFERDRPKENADVVLDNGDDIINTAIRPRSP